MLGALFASPSEDSLADFSVKLPLKHSLGRKAIGLPTSIRQSKSQEIANLMEI
jgi:hypothetical protein